MKKYIIMALLPLVFQGNIYCVDYNADLNKAIQQQLISARKVIGNVKLPLELDPILVALVSYAKRGDNQSVEAINKMENIGAALEQYKVDQYTSWTWYFGPTPAIVKDYIQPAIGKVTDNLKTIQTNAKSAGYTIAAAAATAAISIVAAGVGIAAWFIFKPKSDVDADMGDVYKNVDEAARLKYIAQKYAEAATAGWCSKIAEPISVDQKAAIYEATYAVALSEVKKAEDIEIYSSEGPFFKEKLEKSLVVVAQNKYRELRKSAA